MNMSKRLFWIGMDSFFIIITGLFSYWFVFTHYESELVRKAILILMISMLIFHQIFARIFHLYKKIWEYASIQDLLIIIKMTLYTVISAEIIQYIFTGHIFLRTFLITMLIYMMFIGSSRFVWRVLYERYDTSPVPLHQKRTLIVGAGSAGNMIARQLHQNRRVAELFPIGYVDDDVAKQGLQMYNLPVLGEIADIPHIAKKYEIDLIVIAIPSLHNGRLRDIVQICNQTEAQVQMIPKLEDLVTGRVSVRQLRNVEVEDLLGRQPVKLDTESISESITGETILITGAGGSIGAELCRQLFRFTPKKMILVGHGETSIYRIHQELIGLNVHEQVEIIPMIADIRDRERIFTIVEKFKPRKIYHAAAHKHVPLMEFNPHEAVKNNIIGTKNVAEAAGENGVHTFVLISTDKAVNPTNVMGATKRIAEMIVQQLNNVYDTRFVAVRFGNVLGSRGSVIPLFRRQIAAGGPVTVTDERMTRYFMTIPEASRLVIQAGTLAKGGEIFVLDMGEPIKIIDLAKNLIKLSGYQESEIEIVITGIRPGEKLYEELMNEAEIMPDKIFEKIYIGRTTDIPMNEIEQLLDRFYDETEDALKSTLLSIVNRK